MPEEGQYATEPSQRYSGRIPEVAHYCSTGFLGQHSYALCHLTLPTSIPAQLPLKGDVAHGRGSLYVLSNIMQASEDKDDIPDHVSESSSTSKAAQQFVYPIRSLLGPLQPYGDNDIIDAMLSRTLLLLMRHFFILC